MRTIGSPCMDIIYYVRLKLNVDLVLMFTHDLHNVNNIVLVRCYRTASKHDICYIREQWLTTSTNRFALGYAWQADSSGLPLRRCLSSICMGMLLDMQPVKTVITIFLFGLHIY